MLLTILTLLGLLVGYAWYFNRKKLNYWAERGIPSPPAAPVFGHLHKLASQKRGRWIFDEMVYRSYSKNGLSGLYSLYTPLLLVSDPELIKKMLIKDFDHFTDRRTFKSTHEIDKITDSMLANENGEKWKVLRSTVTPAFSSGKMKNMFQLVCDKSDTLVAFCLKESTKKGFVDMKATFGRYTIDTIASCAYGLECNSIEHEDAEFPKKAMPYFDFGLKRLVAFITIGLMPRVFRLLGLHIFPKENEFFKDIVERTLAVRRQGNKRGDFLDLLLEAQDLEDKSDPSKKQILNDRTIIAQCILFIIAGYDTTATTLSFAAYLLAKNPEAQQRLRQELQDIVNNHGGITYQSIMESKYLDGVLNESLRIYPTSPMVERICSKDYVVPGTEITVKKGHTIQVPVYALHHDEKYWPEPEVFKPERFLPENKANISNYTYMPFGLGPRSCIAMRFALMEAKVAVAKLVLSSEMKLAPGHKELVLSTGYGLLKPDEVNLLLKPISEE